MQGSILSTKIRKNTRNRRNSPRLGFEPLEDRRMMATLSSGDGPGTVDLSTTSGRGVDGYGAFGTNVFGPATGDATLTMSDDSLFAPTVFQSAIAIGSGDDRFYLSSGTVATSTGLSDPTTTVNGGGTIANSSFELPDLGGDLSSLEGLEIAVTQEIKPLDNGVGSMLIQTYTITNSTGAPVEFDVVRYIDPDLASIGSNEGGGHLSLDGKDVVFATDQIATLEDNFVVVAIDAEGGVIPTSNRYEVSNYFQLQDRIIAGDNLDDFVLDDNDSDELIDSPYDVTLALRNVFSLADDEVATYVTRTLWGNDASEIGDIIVDSLTPPKVTQVTISGPNSLDGNHLPNDGGYDVPAGDGDQIRTIPVGGANELSIKFNKSVSMVSGDLDLTVLAGGPVPSVASFTAPSGLNDYTATWTFSTALPAAQYLISLSDAVVDSFGQALDGEWVNPFSVSTVDAAISEFPSGDGYAGGDFNFVFTVLPGDANRSNTVDGVDWLIYQMSFNQSGLGFDGADYNGDGITNSSDNALWNQNFGVDLVDLIFADFDGNGVVNGLDQSIWSSNFGTSGTHADGDANGDGVIDGIDWSILQRQWGLELDWVA